MKINPVTGNKVFVKENEPIERAIRRFKNKVDDTNILKDMREREYYEKPTDVRKRKAGAARARHLREKSKHQLPPKNY
jgi:small subunit ribosomal protein S21